MNVKDPGVGRASRNLIGNEPGQWNLLESRKGVAVVPEGRGLGAKRQAWILQSLWQE